MNSASFGKSQQLSLTLPVTPSYSRDDFVVTKANEQAFLLIDNFQNWGVPPHVLLVGEQYCGKTHLAHIWALEAGALWLHLDMLAADRFVMPQQALVIDGLGQFLAYEDDLFHLVNHMREQKLPVLMTARQAPETLGFVCPDLVSRLRAAFSVGFGLPDEKLLAAILCKQFTDRQIDYETDIIDFILNRIERSFQAVGDFVEKLDHASLQYQRAITKPFVTQILKGNFDEEPI